MKLRLWLQGRQVLGRNDWPGTWPRKCDLTLKTPSPIARITEIVRMHQITDGGRIRRDWRIPIGHRRLPAQAARGIAGDRRFRRIAIAIHATAISTDSGQRKSAFSDFCPTIELPRGGPTGVHRPRRHLNEEFRQPEPRQSPVQLPCFRRKPRRCWRYAGPPAPAAPASRHVVIRRLRQRWPIIIGRARNG